MTETTSIDRSRGVLMGLAEGDRNGGPIRMAAAAGHSSWPLPEPADEASAEDSAIEVEDTGHDERR